MKRDTAWLLRRHRDGGAPDWRVQHNLEREFNRLVEERCELSSEVDELRRSSPDRLRNFDEATDRALQKRAECRFEDALRDIRQAMAELAELRRRVSVAVELANASKAAEEVEALLGAGLAELPTPAVLRRLRSLARQFLDQGETRKAKFVVLLLRSQVDCLGSRRRQESPPGLALMLKELTAGGGAEAVEVLRKLIQEGHLDLAERLAEDLESVLAVRDRSRRASEAPAGSLGPLIQDMKEIRQRADLLSRSLTIWIDGSAPAGGA